jgi:hypothetical protein
MKVYFKFGPKRPGWEYDVIEESPSWYIVKVGDEFDVASKADYEPIYEQEVAQ